MGMDANKSRRMKNHELAEWLRNSTNDNVREMIEINPKVGNYITGSYIYEDGDDFLEVPENIKIRVNFGDFFEPIIKGGYKITKEEINALVGREIKAWRECRGWTRYQLSKNSGVQEISIKKIEEGSGLRVETLYKIMNAMDIDINFTRKPLL